MKQYTKEYLELENKYCEKELNDFYNAKTEKDRKIYHEEVESKRLEFEIKMYGDITKTSKELIKNLSSKPISKILENHLRNWAIAYVLCSYIIFEGINELYLHLVTGGMSMIFIGLFYLLLTESLIIYNNWRKP